MVNVHDDLQIFVVTNERSTFPFVLKGLDEQTINDLDVHVIKNMKWVDALNAIVDQCTTGYFIRCDDDFFLGSVLAMVLILLVSTPIHDLETEEATDYLIVMVFFFVWQISINIGIFHYVKKYWERKGGDVSVGRRH